MIKNRGKLITVEIRKGVFAKMHKNDAIEAGLFKPKTKKIGSGAKNKMKVPPKNKGEETQGDDLGTIPGIGETTVQLLHESGFFSFEQLKNCELGQLPGRARKAVESWRQNQE